MQGHGDHVDIFMDQMEQLTAYVPWMLTNGNHEIDWPTGADRYGINGNTDSGTFHILLPSHVRTCNARPAMQVSASWQCALSDIAWP